MELSLLIPEDFPVGRYRMVVKVAPEGSKRGGEQDADREVVILFNPWCKGMKHMLPPASILTCSCLSFSKVSSSLLARH